ncbi:MAG TPA: thioredoxin domain-containing protein [Candidatus Acidoferrales bacterium]|nr:thioredoxin domain-containing protein [Candidatus Acidoferrales bacterium]
MTHKPQLVFGVVASVLLLGSGASKPKPSATQESRAAAEEAKFEAQKSLGSPTAPIKLEVFDDYECPACDQFYEQTLKILINEYVASGKVFLIHRDFPLPIHKYSRQAARWVNAAARIGKFETVERALFDNQMAWSEYGTENPQGIIKPIVQGALTPAEFQRVERIMQGCESDSHDELKTCSVDAAIQHDLAEGQLLPVMQTPTFVVTCRGKKYPPTAGTVSWPILKQYLDALLNSQ